MVAVGTAVVALCGVMAAAIAVVLFENFRRRVVLVRVVAVVTAVVSIVVALRGVVIAAAPFAIFRYRHNWLLIRRSLNSCNLLSSSQRLCDGNRTIR